MVFKVILAFYCPNAGYGFEDKSFTGKEGKENETGKKHGEPV